ncbi:MAG: hypothetical protein QM572_08295, partial [Nocardioides sp.]|uniref:hypothetical protein n=1 Tax=Nocardioides sp. TaxID=35761 RepID=UPI0039E5E57B
MATTDATLPLPRPASPYAGSLATAWGLLRAGRMRDAATTLSAIDPATLSDAERVHRVVLLVVVRLGMGDLVAAGGSADELVPLLTGAGEVSAAARLAHGDLATALGDHAAALAHFRAAGASPDAAVDLASWRCG